jgi:2-polyprenyl-3-methyl-5-hydroxy-6-metoxy-1,4-benzoquinol methylase
MARENSKQSGRLVRALDGTHERVVENALRYVSAGARALDLGAGSGALAERLQAAGFRVTAADITNYFELTTEFVKLDLNDPGFERALSSEFDLITAVEVVEHLENPTAFLRSICRLLKPNGVAILTTPNVENVPARLKFLLRGDGGPWTRMRRSTLHPSISTCFSGRLFHEVVLRWPIISCIRRTISR